MKPQVITAIAILVALAIPNTTSAKMMKKSPGIDLLQSCLLAGDDKTSTHTVIGGKRDGTWDTCCSKKLGYCISCNREADQCSKRSYRIFIQTMKPKANNNSTMAPAESNAPSPRQKLGTNSNVLKKTNN